MKNKLRRLSSMFEFSNKILFLKKIENCFLKKITKKLPNRLINFFMRKRRATRKDKIS